ncbi:TRM10 [Symbiodinium microadriaticum]|nr:TRM10 [Symbiodinium microadriaticum]
MCSPCCCDRVPQSRFRLGGLCGYGGLRTGSADGRQGSRGERISRKGASPAGAPRARCREESGAAGLATDAKLGRVGCLCSLRSAGALCWQVRSPGSVRRPADKLESLLDRAERGRSRAAGPCPARQPGGLCRPERGGLGPAPGRPAGLCRSADPLGRLALATAAGQEGRRMGGQAETETAEGDVSQCNWLMGDATDATQRAEMTLHVASVQSLTHEGLLSPVGSNCLLEASVDPQGRAARAAMGLNGVGSVLLLICIASGRASESFDAFDAAPAASSKASAASKPSRMEHLRFQRSLVADSEEEAAEVREKERKVFEQGKHIRARKALFEKRLAACYGDETCRKVVAAQQLEIERQVASGTAPAAVVEGREEHKAENGSQDKAWGKGQASAKHPEAPMTTPVPDASTSDSESVALAELAGEGASPPLQKSELKRLRKAELKEQRRLQAKEQRQQKKKAQKQRKQELRQEHLESMSATERAEFLEKEREAGRERKAAIEATLDYSFHHGRPRIVINCSFSDTMDVRELTSLAKQVQLSYTQARDSNSKAQLHIMSLHSQNPVIHSLEKQGMKSWKLHLHEESVWDVFATEAREGRLVVLTPDAEEELLEVLEEEVYVVGGIVDRSVKKMQSRAQAVDQGATKLRKLPLKRFGPTGCCPVLNIDCVVRILCEWLKGDGSWQPVFERCLPPRRVGDRAVLSKRQRRTQRALERAGQATPVDDDG